MTKSINYWNIWTLDKKILTAVFNCINLWQHIEVILAFCYNGIIIRGFYMCHIIKLNKKTNKFEKSIINLVDNGTWALWTGMSD